MIKDLFLIKVLLVFLVSPSVMAKQKQEFKSSKTKNHQCAVYTKNAKKARRLYSQNKTQAVHENKQVQALKTDQRRMPASTKLAKNVVNKKIESLSRSKRQHLMNSLKYLEKHIQYVKAAKRTCNPIYRSKSAKVIKS